MLNKEKQTVGDNSLGVQAGNNVVIHVTNTGLTAADVREICLLLFKENFPHLKAEAVEAAKANVDAYIPILESRIKASIDKIDFQKLAEPDIQASINESVQAAAKKGEKADLGILSELVTARMRSDTPEFLSLVAEEAIRLIPRLTKQQVAFVTLCHYLTSVKHEGLSNIDQLENFAKAFFHLFKEGFAISQPNILHLEYVALCL